MGHMWELELSGFFPTTCMVAFRKEAGACLEEELLEFEKFSSEGP